MGTRRETVVAQFVCQEPAQLRAFFALLTEAHGVEWSTYFQLGDVMLSNVVSAEIDGNKLPATLYTEELEDAPADVRWARIDPVTLIGKHLEYWPYEQAHIDVQPRDGGGWDITTTLEMDPDRTLLRTIRQHAHVMTAARIAAGERNCVINGRWGILYVNLGG